VPPPAAAAARRAESATRLGGLREERQRVADRLPAPAFEEGRAGASLGEVATSRERARARHDALADTRKHAALALQVREEEVRRLAEEHATVREAMVHVRGRLDGLREREEAYDGYAEGIATVMGFANPGPCALLVDALEIPAELEPAGAAVVGEVWRGAVVSSREEGAAVADRLRRTAEGRVSLVPVDARATTGAELPLGGEPLESFLLARPG